MLNLLSPVRLTDPGPRDGILKGFVGDYLFEARLARGAVSYGLDPDSLYKGHGRIIRLTLHRCLVHQDVTLKVAAFDHGWLYGRKDHLNTVRRIVDYLERRTGSLA